ncbi:MAG TPA: hypothetical protein VMT76_17345 [Puia sp.]|nr:hypothetical protein [Puia sp.]
MKLNLFIATLIVLFIHPINIKAQSNWQQGYIIANNGDTVKGYIGFKDSRVNPGVISFSVNEDKKQAKFYKAGEIKGFMIEGETPYTSYVGDISTNSTDLDHLVYTNDPRLSKMSFSKTDSIYLRQLVQGKISLYESFDFKSHYFLQYSDGRIFELLNMFYLVSAAHDYKLNDKVYQRQIDSFVMANKINLTEPDELQRINYRRDDLAQLVTKLNSGNFGWTKPVRYRSRKLEQRIGVGAGVFFSNLKYSGLYILVTSTGNDIGPLIWLHYDFSGFINSNKFFGRIEGQWQQISLTANSQNDKNSAKIQNLSIIPSINYSFIKNKLLELYAGFGVNINLNIKNSGPTWSFTTKVYDSSNNSYNLVEYYDEHPVRSIWPDIRLTAGIIFIKNFEASVGYDFKSSISSIGSAGNLRIQYLSARLAYIISI